MFVKYIKNKKYLAEGINDISSNLNKTDFKSIFTIHANHWLWPFAKQTRWNLLFADQFHSLAQEGHLDENIVMDLLP